MNRQTVPSRAPVLDLKEAAALAEKAKARGLLVVFTNGCFDLIHSGHMEVLERARSMGDLLLVGLNTDDSVRRLKGPSRPLQDLAGRASVLSCIRFVDIVVPFGEDTPLNLIRAIMPNVLVKGGDYRSRSVVGAAEVEEAGGRVVIVPLLQGYSTSAIIGGRD